MIIAFGILTNNEEYYLPCSQSSSTYQWSVITFYSYIAVFVIHPILTCIEKKTSGKIFLCFAFVARLAALVIILVCYGGLIYAYEYEDCGSLTTLALVYIILISIGASGLGLVVCGLLCACIIGSGAVIALKASENSSQTHQNAAANSNQTNQNAGGYNAFEEEKV